VKSQEDVPVVDGANYIKFNVRDFKINKTAPVFEVFNKISPVRF
jgi:hypothetical protein